MITIESPIKGYTGISAGVGFALGKALVKELTPTQKNYFKKKGYVVKEDVEGISHHEVAAKVETIDETAVSNENNNLGEGSNSVDFGAID